MRKHKSVVAILLAVMMIFTFMPTMAFAGTASTSADVQSWGEKYSTVTDKDGDTFVTKRTFDTTNNNSGVTNVDPQDGTNDTTIGNQHLAPSGEAYFYDLDGSYFANENTKLDGSSWYKSKFDTELRNADFLSVVLVQHDYDSVYDKKYTDNPATYDADKAAKKAFVLTKQPDGETWVSKTPEGFAPAQNVGFRNWTMTVKMKGYDENATGDQTVTFEVTKIESATENTAATVQNWRTPDLVGTVAKATVTVKADPTTPDNAKYYLDTVGGDYSDPGANTSGTATTLKGRYDGAAHKIVADEVAGWTPNYAVYNTSTGRYDEMTSGVSITDVQSTDMLVKVTWKKTGQNDKTRYVKVNLDPVAKVWSFGFLTTKEVSNNDNTTTYKAVYDVVGTDYNAADYFGIAVDPVEKYDSAGLLADKAAAKSAVAANQSELMNLFNDFFDIEAKVAKGSVTPVTLYVDDKVLGTTEAAEQKAVKALLAKYETLIRNFGLQYNAQGNYFFLNGNEDVVPTATLNLNSEIVDEEVEFTQAPTVKTYKGSKTTKKGKLKKNQSFTVTAVSNKGRAIAYKLVNVNTSKITINKTSGKITVKKGLTKGTYTIKVKAYVPGHSTGVNALYETQTIKIKIKK